MGRHDREHRSCSELNIGRPSGLPSAAVVQWLRCLVASQETGVRFPLAALSRMLSGSTLAFIARAVKVQVLPTRSLTGGSPTGRGARNVSHAHLSAQFLDRMLRGITSPVKREVAGSSPARCPGGRGSSIGRALKRRLTPTCRSIWPGSQTERRAAATRVIVGSTPTRASGVSRRLRA